MHIVYIISIDQTKVYKQSEDRFEMLAATFYEELN